MRLSPLRGLRPMHRSPTARAVGYALAALRAFSVTLFSVVTFVALL